MAEPVPSGGSIAEPLKSLGLTKYEALVYVALLKASGATATELHELSGVPRASVYPVLERLSQKHLVSVSNTSPKRFNPVKPDDAIDLLMRSIESDATRAKTELSRVYAQAERPARGDQELIWSIHGDDQIRSRLFELLRGARSSVQIIFYWDHLKEELITTLLSLAATVRVDIITDRFTTPVPDRIHVTVRTPPESHGIATGKCMAGGVVIVDGKQAMVVMGSKEEGFTALYSEASGFIRFFTMYWNFFSSWIRT
ncbi:MAG: TrmB family transcriptional regulator [Methanomicrobiales archaeon]|nr:TrmB family transcriptional regulator [Methanomicrobiales archaeon]NYT20294.1 TrmB family transcriptional regulator [Methanomicrobiales archaeon]